MRSLTSRPLFALSALLAFGPGALSAQADSRLESLKDEVLQMVEADAKTVQEIVDMLFSLS